MVYILTLRQCFLFRKVVLSQVYLIAELVLTDCVQTIKAILRYQNRGRSTCVDLLPPENLVNDGTVKKKVDSYIRYPDGKCGLSHYPSSIRRSHTHVVIVTNWCCKIHCWVWKMNNHFFLLHWVKCSSKGGSVLWVDISNTTIKVRTIPYDYDGIALTSIYIYIPPMTERQDLSAIQQHMFLIFSLQREKLQLRSWPYACNRKLTFIDSSLNLKHCSVSLEYFYFLLKFIVTIEEPVFHWRYRENRW